jgi:hypothetical protein
MFFSCTCLSLDINWVNHIECLIGIDNRIVSLMNSNRKYTFFHFLAHKSAYYWKTTVSIVKCRETQCCLLILMKLKVPEIFFYIPIFSTPFKIELTFF